MRSFDLPRLHLRPHVLAANRRTLQLGRSLPRGPLPPQGQHPTAASARQSGAVGGGGARPEPHRCGDGSAYFSYGFGGGKRAMMCALICTTPFVAFSAPAQGGRAWVTDSFPCRCVWAAGRSFSRILHPLRFFCAYLNVKNPSESRVREIRMDGR